MTLRVCICCGERMSEKSRSLSRERNICASCSSFLDVKEWFKDSRDAALDPLLTSRRKERVPEPA